MKSRFEPPAGYYSAPWVTEVVLPHIQHLVNGLEPAAGIGGMSKVLTKSGKRIASFDIRPYEDEHVTIPKRNFLQNTWAKVYDDVRRSIQEPDGGIITSPPPHLVEKFISKAIEITRPHGTVAMWLDDRIDSQYKYRQYFSVSSDFYKKVVPIQRMRLLDDVSKPMCWYIWRHGYGMLPTIHYFVVDRINSGENER